MKFTTKTVYDYPHMLDLQIVAGKTFAKKQMNKKRLTALGLGVVCLVMDAMLAMKGKEALWVALFAVPGVLMLGWGIMFYPATARATCRAMGKSLQHNDFDFEDDAVIAWRGSESTEYPYDHCSALLETELCYYLLLTDGGGLILDKANIQGGAPTELVAFLEERTGKKLTWMGK